jgi:hypothetical protein
MMYKYVAALSLLLGSLAASATTTETWSFKTGQTAYGSSSLTLTSSEGSTATVSGWSSAQSTASSIVTHANRLTLDSTWGAQLWNNSDSGSPSHAIDNTNGFDFLLLEFANPVNLISLTNSWMEGFSWVSVGAFAENPFSGGAVNWQQVANSAIQTASYQDTGVNTAFTFANNAAIAGGAGINNIFATTWLVGTYNYLFNGSNHYIGDHIKLASIVTSTNGSDTSVTVPAPATFFLFAVALLGLLLSQRRA